MKGWTQLDLANKLNVTRPLVGAWEEKRCEPSYEVLRVIAWTFNIEDPLSLVLEDIKPGLIKEKKPQERDVALWKAINEIRNILNALPS